MPLYKPAKQFVQMLHDFDPALRIRWSDGQDQWRLERRVSRGQVWPPSTLETAAAFEDRQAAKDGYILVELIPHNRLDARLIPLLAQADIWSHGGADAVADALDRLDIEQKHTARQVFLDRVEDEARARWRYMNRVRTLDEHHTHSAPTGGMSINGGV